MFNGWDASAKSSVPPSGIDTPTLPLGEGGDTPGGVSAPGGNTPRVRRSVLTRGSSRAISSNTTMVATASTTGVTDQLPVTETTLQVGLRFNKWP